LISDRLDQHARDTPEQIAFVDSRQTISYSQLQELTWRIAVGLQDRGLKRGDVVAIQLPNWIEFPSLYVALVRLGAVASLIPPMCRENEVAMMLKLSNAKWYVCADSFRGFNFEAMAQSLQEQSAFKALQVLFVSHEMGIESSWEQALNAVQGGDTRGRTLRVHMPPSLLQKMGLPMLRDFRREFPDVLLDVSSSYVTGLPDQDLDVAIVFDRPSVDDRVTDLLWMVRVTPVCSPELAKLAEGKTLAEFLTEQDLLHVKLESEPRSLLWSLFATQLGLAANTEKGLAFDTAISAVQYAISGGGLALADVDMFADELADGRLVQPFPTVMEDGYGYYLKFHAEDLGDPVISHFRTWVLGRFGATAAKGSRLGPGATQQNEL
jgi:LysR family glycine cleavage system transcriptional activator